MISIIVPVYKVELYLRQCLDSIVNQTYRDLEIILIDDCSPDRCGEICDKYAERDNRIRVFHLPENRGLSAARNIGLDNARGEYIGFVDSDDWIELDMYEVLLKEIMDADIVEIGDSINGRESFLGSEILKALLVEKISNVVWNKLYRIELFKNVIFPVGCNFEDVAIMHWVVKNARIVTVMNRSLYHHRKRSDSISEDNKAKNLIDYYDAYMARYIFFCEEKSHIGILEQSQVLKIPALGISKVWRWWAGCSDQERYSKRIREMEHFSRENFPLTGFKDWPLFLRVSSIFMHSRNKVVFAVLYVLNQVYRKVKRGNLA